MIINNRIVGAVDNKHGRHLIVYMAFETHAIFCRFGIILSEKVSPWFFVHISVLHCYHGVNHNWKIGSKIVFGHLSIKKIIKILVIIYCSRSTKMSSCRKSADSECVVCTIHCLDVVDSHLQILNLIFYILGMLSV